MNLLQPQKREAPPRAWLLTRICGRRAATGGRALSWGKLTREYAWVFARLDRQAAATLSPYFSLFELKRLLTCLRLRRGEDSSRVGALLTDSLLHESLQKLLLTQGEFSELLRQILPELIRESAALTRVYQLLKRQRWPQLEETIFEAGLRQALKDSRSAVVQDFFRELIDVRNLLAVHKALRWQEKTAPEFLAGGDIAPKRLRQAFARGEIPAMARFGAAGAGDPGRIEERLLQRLEHRLRRRGREGGGIALILHYLWSLYLGTRTRAGRDFVEPFREAS